MDDAVEEEFDVFVDPSLTPHLHLLSFPSVLLSTAPLLNARFKPASGRLEATAAVAPDTAVPLHGEAWPWRPAQYFLAKFCHQGMLAWPVDSTIVVSPKGEDAPPTPSSPSTANAPPAPPAPKAIHIQFRRKETDEQVRARLSSHAHLQRQVDDEPWIPLAPHPNPGDALPLLPTLEDIAFDSQIDYLDHFLKLT